MKKFYNKFISQKLKMNFFQNVFGMGLVIFLVLTTIPIRAKDKLIHSLLLKENIEYRLFNLALKVPISFTVEEINPYRVRFVVKNTGSIRENLVILEIYYFPSHLQKVGPKSIQDFLKSVWPEVVEVKKNGHSTQPVKKQRHPFLLDIGIRVDSVFFNTKSFQKIKFGGNDALNVAVFHWQDGQRRYFLHLNYFEKVKGIYEEQVVFVLENMKMIYQELDRNKILTKIKKVNTLLKKRKINQKMNISNIKKLFLPSFYFQGHLRNGQFKNLNFPNLGTPESALFFLEQDDLSLNSHPSLKEHDFLTLKENIDNFKGIFTSGDIVVYSPRYKKSSLKEEMKKNENTWLYFIFRKVEGNWLIYAIGYEIASKGKAANDSGVKIFW